MTLLLTEGWRGSASSADNGGGITQRAANMKGWTIYNPGTNPTVSGSGTSGWSVTSGGNGTVAGGFDLNPRTPTNGTLIGGASFVLGARWTQSGGQFWIENPSGPLDGGGGVSGAPDSNTHLTFVPSSTAWAVHRGTAAGTLLGTSTGTPLDGTSHYMELKVVIDATTGSIVMKQDGVVILNLTGINTQGASGTNIGGFHWRSNPSNAVTLGDIVLMDLNGSVNNDFLGDVHIETLQATGDGHYTNFAPNSGVNHFSRIQEMRIPDGATSYVQSLTLNAKDTYTHESLLATTGVVYGAVVYAVAEKSDTPPRGLKTMMRSSTSDVIGAVESALAQDYLHILGQSGGNSLAYGVFEIDPATSAAWTIAGINASEYGVTVSS